MSFEQLKQRSQNKDALIEKLSSLDNSKEKKSYKDERFNDQQWMIPARHRQSFVSCLNVKMKKTLPCFTILTLSKVRGWFIENSPYHLW